MLPKKHKFKICGTKNLPLILCRCKICM